MPSDLIVDFAQHQRSRRAVHFSETSELHIFTRPKVDRNDLWYTKRDYARMKLAIRRDVLAARTSREALVGNTSSGVCFMGIEHLLSAACTNEVMTCRARCIQAVLTEQARVMDASAFATSVDGWDRIALASIAQTRRARLRARKLGQLHQESS